MAKGKWIGGVLGLLSGGPLGALAGFVLGSMFDMVDEDRPNRGAYTSLLEEESEPVEAERNGFLFALLTLMSYIIKSDGKIMHSEMETARSFLRTNFGPVAAQQGEEIMLRLFERQKQMDAQQPGAYRQTIQECCNQLRSALNEAQRLQILSLLAALVKADGNIDTAEVNALREITLNMGLSETEMNSMLNLGSTTLDDAYAVLEIEPTATDDEVRAAYKRMVVKHHPDRVAALGDDVRAAAEKKLQQINEAKELIFKHRGL